MSEISSVFGLPLDHNSSNKNAEIRGDIKFFYPDTAGVNQSYVVPETGLYALCCVGASGLSPYTDPSVLRILPGRGGIAFGVCSLPAGQSLVIQVGCTNGFPGGGAVRGGGYSGFFAGSVSQANAIVVAGGGGGVGGITYGASGSTIGRGGDAAANMYSASAGGGAAYSATTVRGGLGGLYNAPGTGYGSATTGALQGGSGNAGYYGASGAGGGGYFGGGDGELFQAGDSYHPSLLGYGCAGGGAGGSSFVSPGIGANIRTHFGFIPTIPVNRPMLRINGQICQYNGDYFRHGIAFIHKIKTLKDVLYFNSLQ